jgi:hypothetical protein
MKRKFQYSLCLLSAIFFTACQKDNYPAPGSRFTGAIMYKGDTVRVASGQVNFELWQSGFGKLTPINVMVDQKGTFSALLFNGDYKLDFQDGQGPFMASQIDPKTNSDTMAVKVQGATSLNIEVMPYYMIRSPQFSVSGKQVNATCQLEKIITDANARDVESVTLYINKTYFADNNNNIATASISGGDITDMNHISLTAGIPDMTPTQNYIFARIGVKIANVEDMIFSPVVKLNF